MSVSITPNLDLNAIVNGGPDFINRMKQFQDNAAIYKKTLDDMNLGRDAVAAHDEAHRVLGAAKEKRDADLASLEKEVADARAAVTQWSADTKAQAQGILDDATAKQADIDSKLKQADAAHQVGRDIINDATNRAEGIKAIAQKEADQYALDKKQKADDHFAEAATLRAKAEEDAAKAAADRATAEAIMAKVSGAFK